MNNIFVTGTDTEIGKTYISTALLKIAGARHLSTIGLKPVASGCLIKDDKLFNEDALLLQQASSCHLSYDLINPFAFLPPIAPHIAAQQKNIELNVATLIQQTKTAITTPADVRIIEGFGGWHAPLNAHETMADYAKALQCDIILVVGMRLGCINHAILTERAITTMGLNCLGWVANMIDINMACQNETLATLQTWLSSPLLGTVQHGEAADIALSHIRTFNN